MPDVVRFRSEKVGTVVVGFRYWLWPPLVPEPIRSLYPWHNSVLLWGTFGAYPWQATEMRAIHAWGPRHRDPMEDCLCGIHGFTRWRARERLSWFDQWPTSIFGHQVGLVGGAIIAWGRIAEHGTVRASEGFRAEHARILALGDSRAAALYRVPYVAESGMELYASEFGVRLDELHQ